MERQIQENLKNAEALEKLYRSDRSGFIAAFNTLYPQISNLEISRFWKARLQSGHRDEIKIEKKEVLYLVLTCVLVGVLVKIPQLFSLNAEEIFFFQKNAGLIVFVGIAAYACLTRGFALNRPVLLTLLFSLGSVIYMNLLPSNDNAQTIILACLHLPVVLWFLYGLIFMNFESKNLQLRMEYLKHNGELAILIALIGIAGGILTGITAGLFSAIDIDIETFYVEYIVIWGLVSVPIVATFIIRHYPQVASKIAPIIANIFSPLVLLTLIVYLVSILITGKDPYNDRDFLLVFNLTLLGVMAIIVFSVSGISREDQYPYHGLILLALTVITLVVDLIALSAIIYRLNEYGFTPNRTVVLGSNLLIFGNLVLIMIDLYKVNFRKATFSKVETTIAKYLPVYLIWSILVVFLLPLIFKFQ